MSNVKRNAHWKELNILSHLPHSNVIDCSFQSNSRSSSNSKFNKYGTHKNTSPIAHDFNEHNFLHKAKDRSRDHSILSRTSQKDQKVASHLLSQLLKQSELDIEEPTTNLKKNSPKCKEINLLLIKIKNLTKTFKKTVEYLMTKFQEIKLHWEYSMNVLVATQNSPGLLKNQKLSESIIKHPIKKARSFDKEIYQCLDILKKYENTREDSDTISGKLTPRVTFGLDHNNTQENFSEVQGGQGGQRNKEKFKFTGAKQNSLSEIHSRKQSTEFLCQQESQILTNRVRERSGSLNGMVSIIKRMKQMLVS